MRSTAERISCQKKGGLGGFVNGGTTERRETRLKRETQMPAETAGMDADCSNSRESSRHLDRYSFFGKRSGGHYWIPERPLFQNEFSLGAEFSNVCCSGLSAAIPEVSAAICVSLGSLVFG